MSINVLAFSSYYLPGYKGGGPIKTIKNLLDQAGSVISFKVVTGDRDLGDTEPYATVLCGAWNKLGNALVFYSRSGLSGYIQIARQLCFQDYDLIYINSFFSPRFSFFPLLMAKLLRKKIVLGPRGEFSEGALSIKSGRKWVFITLSKLLRLHHNVVFQASSVFEAEDISRSLGPLVDIHIAEDIGAQEFSGRFPLRADGSLKAVFVSRISPKKNLLGALEVLRDVQGRIDYYIYGPIEDFHYWQQCEAVIAGLPAHINVIYKGALLPEDVVGTISQYDVFFFPTKGENYGHVIAEALCAALPVVIADTTPWRNLNELGIGWDLSLEDPVTFCRVLDGLASMPPEEHFQMRQRILAWARTRFSQRDAVDANIAMFNYAFEKK